MNAPSRFLRRGSSLVITMIVMVGIVAMISMAADSLTGVQTLASLDLDRQRARFAAETVAAMVEAQLTERSGDLEKLKQNLDDSLADDPALWWGLKGYCYDANGNYDATRPGLWINRCLVRWRLEPVVVLSKTLDESGLAPNATFTLNSEPDPQHDLYRKQQAENRAAANLAGAKLMATDPGLFHYRIVTEAYALADGRHGNAVADVRNATLTPWTTAGLHTCTVQAQRVVQLELINLFRYALFHAQEDARGDIDLQTGQQLTITDGAVHSNAAIYIRGGEFSGFMSGPDYHRMACGDDGHGGTWQPITLGSAAKPIDVVGVRGIFRMGKTANILAGVNNPTNAEVQSYANPSLVPPHDPASGAPVSGTWIKGSKNDLNGDHPTSTRHSINGVSFTSINDSRSRAKFQEDFKDRVRDQNNGGAVVTSLANIPELAGRPLEFQRMPDENAPLYRTAGGILTVRRPPAPNDRPLHYQTDPKVSSTPALGTTAPGFGPVGAHGMRLWWSTNYRTQDVDPAAAGSVAGRVDGNPLAPPALATDDRDFVTGDGFHDREVKGKYLEWALFGRLIDSPRYYTTWPATLASTGLVIRERPAQLPGAGGVHPSLAAVQAAYAASGFNAYRQAYADYLKTQYVVLMAGRNITGVFFDDILTANEQTYREAEFIVTEDEFVDARESSSLAGMYGLNPQDFSPARGIIPASDPQPAAGAIDPRTAHKQNVLTLNVRRIQDFLARNAAAVDAALNPALELRDYFNGLLYVHRTRRSSTFNPVNGARFRWIAPLATITGSTPPSGGIYAYMFGGRQMLDYSRFDAVTGDPQLFASRLRDIDGPLDATRCNVRIRGGLISDGAQRARQAEIDWNHTPARRKLGTSGLSIVTPDRLYLWGDFNTTTHPDDDGIQRTTPCAIFADGVTALSARWRDEEWQVYAPSSAWGSPPRTYLTGAEAEATTYITSFVINNVPNAAWNANSFGTGGSADTIHLMERWSGRDFIFRGSMVVLNEQRYSKTLHYYAASPLSNGVRVFETGNARITFNTDLLTRDGQPPFSPFGVKVTRVVSTLNTTNN